MAPRASYAGAMTHAPLLEVTVVHERDVPGAREGGADRLHLTRPEGTAGLSPEPAVLARVLRESDLPVRVDLRLHEGWSTTGSELARLLGLAEDYLALGAEGVCFGFLTEGLELDVEVCRHLAEQLPGVPWTCNPAVDHALEPARTWRALLGLPGLTAIRSAGSPRGLVEGYEDLLAAAESSPRLAALLMPGEGLLGEHVPWLLRAGVTQFHLGPQARPDGSPKAYVDARWVRSWRLLLDDTAARAAR